MENLLVRSLFEYVRAECLTAFSQGAGRPEVRLFTASFPADVLLGVFERLAAFITLERPGTQMCVKVGKPLWEHWCAGPPDERPVAAILATFESHAWVDHDDRLTFYRNLKCHPQNDALVVLLAGADRVLDKGGLADFHHISERTLWQRQLDCSYKTWMVPFLEGIGIDVTPSLVEELDDILQTIFSVVPQNLAHLARFLGEASRSASSFSTGSDVVAYVFASLSEWGLFPVLNPPKANKSRKALIKASAAVARRTPYIDKNGRTRTLKRIAEMRKDPIDHEVPEPIGCSDPAFKDFDELAAALVRYIEIGDAHAREALMHSDFAVVNKVLNYKLPVKTRPDREKRLYGPALSSFMSAIWETVEAFKSEIRPDWAPAAAASISVEVVRFHHDLGPDEREAALQLYGGLLGGIRGFLERDLELREDRGDEEALRKISIGVSWELDSDAMRSVKSRDAYVEFNVSVVGVDENDTVSKRFRWIVDSTHEERVLQAVANRTLSQLDGKLLPAFEVPTYTELFFAADVEEAHRLLEISEAELRVVELVTADLKPRLNKEPEIQALMVKAVQSYQSLVRRLVQDGYFVALRDPVLNLLRALEDVYKAVLTKEHVAGGDIGAALYKSFLLLPKGTDPCEPALATAIAFGLTPAVLEQLQAREIFLSTAFPHTLARLFEEKASRRELHDLFGMVELKRPVLALVKDRDFRVTTRHRSLGHVHAIGDPPVDVLSLASQAFMREEDVEDEDVSDSNLFASSQESRVYTAKLREYYENHPVARDGMRVLAIDVENIQTLVAGVHEFFKDVLDEENRPSAQTPPFQFKLHVYLRSASALSIQKWLDAWQRRWDPSKGLAIYPNCSLSIAFRHAQEIEDYRKLLEENPESYDVAFVVRFLRAHEGGDYLEHARPFALDNADSVTLKFPITEAPRPATMSVQDRLRRQTNLSNRRLRLPTLHAELSARLKRSTHPEHLVFAAVDYKPWALLIDELHTNGRCAWVVCMDPYVDRGLLAHREGEKTSARELVGFTSGLGGLGELNVTVSTETGTVETLTREVGSKLAHLFHSWKPETTRQAAQALVSQAQKLSGFSLIKAVDNGESIRDVVAHALVRRVFPTREDVLCDVILSVDSYQHWLDSRMRAGGPKYRPDLLHLIARLKGEEIEIDACVIECKLAFENDRLLSHALEQVETGLSILVRNFLPYGRGAQQETYMRRYWWAQLQRAIAAHSRIEANQSLAVSSALERLGEGFFHIKWRGLVTTFWTDRVDSPVEVKLHPGIQWREIGLDADDTEITHVAFGASDVATLALGGPCEFTVASSCLGLSPRGTKRGTGPLLPVSSVVPKATTFGDSQSLTMAALAMDLASQPSSHDIEEMAPNLTDTRQGLVAAREAPEDERPNIVAHDDNALMQVAGGNNPASATEYQLPNDPMNAEPVPGFNLQSGQPQSTASIPSRILLGLSGTEREVYWEFGHSELTNRHFLIFGRSGVGKTYAIQCILGELARHGQHATIIDYTEGFLPNRLEPGLKALANPQTHLVLSHPLPMNPMRPMVSEIEGIGTFPEKPHETAGRIMSVFDAVYNLGEQQAAKLVDAVKSLLAQKTEDAQLKNLVEALLASEGVAASSGAALASKIKPFIEANAFGDGDGGGWKKIYSDSESFLNIIQLARQPREFARIITEFALWDLYGYAQNAATEKTPLPIVLDEVQTLSHKLDAPIAKILTEGRKFGLAGIFATQTMSNLKDDEQDRLFQAAHKLFFAPADSELREYARLLAGPTGEPVNEWITRLSSLGKGECWSYGPVLEANGRLKTRPMKIRITPIEKRGFGGFQ